MSCKCCYLSIRFYHREQGEFLILPFTNLANPCIEKIAAGDIAKNPLLRTGNTSYCGVGLFDRAWQGVVGVVVAKLDASTTFEATGSLPENVNYAVKSSYLLGFLEAVPAVTEGLLDARTEERKF